MVIESGTFESFLFAFHSNYGRIFSHFKQWLDLEIWVWGRSKSLKMAQFNRPCMTFYQSAIVTIALSSTICELGLLDPQLRYHILRKDRVRVGGGVAAFIKRSDYASEKVHGHNSPFR